MRTSLCARPGGVLQRSDSVDCWDHVRGMELHDILRGCGRLLRSSCGTDETYRLSKPTTHLDGFISHTWSTPSWKKWMALCLQYNFKPAVLCTLLVCGIMTTFCALGWLPLANMESEPFLLRNPYGPYCTVLSYAVFFVVLHVASDFSHLVPRRRGLGMRVFLDKACINQTDAEKKAKGIQNLDKFALAARTFILLQSDDYLERLWTVYELGTVLLLKSSPHVLILPVSMPPFLFACSTVLIATELLNFPLRTTAFVKHGFNTTLRVVVPVAMHMTSLMAFILSLRRWQKEQQRRSNQLEAFSAHSAQCTAERDRAFVQANIAVMVQRVFGRGSEVDELLIFEHVVRRRLPLAMKASMGGRGFPLHYCFAVWISFMGAGFDTLGADLHAGQTIREAAPRFFFWIFWVMPGGSMLFLCICTLSSQCLQLQRAGECAYMVLVCCLCALYVCAFQAGNSVLRATAETTDAGALLYCGVMLVQLAICCCFLGAGCYQLRSHWRHPEIDLTEFACRSTDMVSVVGASATPASPQPADTPVMSASSVPDECACRSTDMVSVVGASATPASHQPADTPVVSPRRIVHL